MQDVGTETGTNVLSQMPTRADVKRRTVGEMEIYRGRLRVSAKEINGHKKILLAAETRTRERTPDGGVVYKTSYIEIPFSVESFNELSGLLAEAAQVLKNEDWGE